MADQASIVTPALRPALPEQETGREGPRLSRRRVALDAAALLLLAILLLAIAAVLLSSSLFGPFPPRPPASAAQWEFIPIGGRKEFPSDSYLDPIRSDFQQNPDFLTPLTRDKVKREREANNYLPPHQEYFMFVSPSYPAASTPRTVSVSSGIKATLRTCVVHKTDGAWKLLKPLSNVSRNADLGWTGNSTGDIRVVVFLFPLAEDAHDAIQEVIKAKAPVDQLLILSK